MIKNANIIDHKASYHEDDRAQRVFDIANLEKGQINISYVHSTEHITAWHVHGKQVDYFYCIKGSFKVGLARWNKEKSTHDVEFVYISDKNQKGILIPPDTWHGYMALEPDSIMLYYLSEKYDPNDEQKCPPGSFNEEWEAENR